MTNTVRRKTRGVPDGLRVFPASLLLANRRCLVVGGGKVAFRKVSGLLEAEADVTVVSPELDERLVALAQAGRIRHVRRAFEDRDPEGHAIAFAATGSKPVNRQVLAACRARRVLCCLVDGNWMEGDFLTPATFRKWHLTVSVSTGGRSCRRSRLVKDYLSKHADMVETADCAVIGTSHHQLSLRERESLHLRGARLEETGRMLRHVWGVHEFLLLDTCNRVEALAVQSGHAGTSEAVRRILGLDRLPSGCYYEKRGFEAFEHAAMLSAGLLSQMPGEHHIVAQVKEALALAARRGWAGGMMAEWIAAALHISRGIRRHESIVLGRGEIEDACIGYLGERTAGTKARIVVLGTGVVGRGLVRRLAAAGRTCEWIYHRNAPSATSLPAGVRLRPWQDLSESLRQADAVVAATASREPVLGPSLAAEFGANRPVLLVDLATPRNIDPALAGALPAARLADLDDLKAWHCRTAGSLETALRAGQAAVREHKAMYEAIIERFQVRNKGE
jgi:glutamyl-tRNA reductase